MTREEYIAYLQHISVTKSQATVNFDDVVTDVIYTVNLQKSFNEDRVVQGFASVSMVNGKPFVDKAGDIIPPLELEKTVDRFNTKMTNGVIKIDHRGEQVGQITQSVVVNEKMLEFFMKQFAPSMVLPCPIEKSCAWFIKAKITSDDAWSRIQSNELRAFSIGAFATRRLHANS